MFKVLLEPDLQEALIFLNESVNALLTIYSECEILYSGRAKSRASLSPRLTIIKPDGSVIIHGPTKREPVNWQPPGSRIEYSIESGVLTVNAERKRPKERLSILHHRVYYITSSEVKPGEFFLVGREKDEVDFIINNPDVIEGGFKPIHREYRTPYGTVDLIGKDKEGNLVVLEFKRAKASLQAVSQLYRYIMYFKEIGENARGILVAPGISENALNLLKRLELEYVNISDKLGDSTISRPINYVPNLQRD
ncbi:endonuclease NucS [Sulfolobus acidocaldarius]|uniref:Endonuclease NucS n=4 Tax=Sulfolobus acidocaldarius TaxID=2285 RepID=NUCS_SULAC|nr:endonuclease NucS [Sulfolobus acidocaldarius]Q4JC60.1 RecName: Full=Endonuclease NucS [Sulfolobus acidocaldarius DSM 639]AAY79619.1 conserved protein [Sulfolobus acidocaldarius DSM 639]AGE70173.1 hypothetical protein SacN8_00960 [Sulfolobus acidocaldarius N8]AGE72448.1 hypothetical protein SacRon12I_00960 [Sulfolobus acidocaldarius Ron12/I]ALU29417.1 endonuclease [Sulfolobus acidocaldarius]ALU32145.1 endonuclease [Sulfolobus acidocaldarius]